MEILPLCAALVRLHLKYQWVQLWVLCSTSERWSYWSKSVPRPER